MFLGNINVQKKGDFHQYNKSFQNGELLRIYHDESPEISGTDHVWQAENNCTNATENKKTHIIV